MGNDAQTDDPRLREFLAKRDHPCPNCRYNLRDLTRAACPECGMTLRLTIGLAEPHMGSWVAGLIGLAAGMGFYGMVLLTGLIQTLGGGYGTSTYFLLWFGVPTVLHASGIGVWVHRRGWIRSRKRDVRALLAGACWTLPILTLGASYWLRNF